MKANITKGVFSPLRYITLYQAFVGNSLYFFVAVSFLVGLVESLGISTILPLLVLGSGADFPENRLTSFFTTSFDFFGLDLTIQNTLFLIVIIFGIKAALVFVRGAFRSYLSTRLSQSIKADISIKYGESRYSYFYKRNIGDLTNIVSTEGQRAVGGFIKLSSAIVAMTNVMIYMTFAFVLNFKSAILVISIGGLIHFLYKKIRKIVSLLSVKVSKSNGKIQNLTIQFISNIKYLKTTEQKTKVLSQITDEIEDNRKLQYKNLLLTEFVISSFELINAVVFAVIIYILVVVDGQSMLIITIPLVFLYKGLGQIATLQGQWQTFLSKSGGIETIQKELSELDKYHEETGSIEGASFLKNHIRLKNINYVPGGKKILKSINLEIKRGETIGFAGASGAGKTTLVDIISSLISPTSGTIEIDGLNYEQIDKLWLRNFFGYVTQDPVVFNDTVRNNITMWEKPEPEKLEKVIKLADCEGLIKQQSNGLETLIGDRGITLSGGQKQKIAIARELYRDCELLIFDEATASLDTQSEQEIQKSIERLKGLKTILIIAHRLSTLNHCDSVIIMENGNIIERGRLKNLMNDSKSRLYQMIEMQAMGR